MTEPRKRHWSMMMLRIAWPIEVALCIIYTMIMIPAGSSGEIDGWLRALPLLTTLIAGQGLIAAGGSEVKRLIESRRDGGPQGG